MKNKPTSIRKVNLLLLIPSMVFVALLFGYFGVAFFLLNSNDAQNRAWINSRTSWVKSHEDKLLFVYTDIFPKAKECVEKSANQNQITENCELEIRQLIDDNLATPLGYEGEIGRRPIFFIRLKDENVIEKLYQSGGYRIENVDTKGERMVVQMLEGKKDPFAYPQYNCCGGDDIVPSIPILGQLLPPRVYLKDFPTEIEQIYLMRNETDEIVGALVYLYGD